MFGPFNRVHQHVNLAHHTASYPKSFGFISRIHLCERAYGQRLERGGTTWMVIGPTCSFSQSSRPTRHVSASLASWLQFKASCWCDGWHLTHVSAPWLATVHRVFSLNSFQGLLVLKRERRKAFSAVLSFFFFHAKTESNFDETFAPAP